MCDFKKTICMQQELIRGDKKKQEQNRKKVVDYLKGKSKTNQRTHQGAALLFNLSKSAVDKIWLRYKNGNDKFDSKKRGPKKDWKLSDEQKRKIKLLINRKPPEGSNLGSVTWTVNNVKALILRECKIEDLSSWQVNRYLKDWGYTSQEPIKLMLKKKSESERRWFEKLYSIIRKAAKKHNAVIYFGDETGREKEHLKEFDILPSIGDGTVVHGSKESYYHNKISAISSKGHLQFSIVRGNINGYIIQTFLEALEKNCYKKVFYITDSAYKTKRLDKWSRTNEKINVCFLPTNFQELNSEANESKELRKLIDKAFQISKNKKTRNNSVDEAANEEARMRDISNDFEGFGHFVTFKKYSLHESNKKEKKS